MTSSIDPAVARLPGRLRPSGDACAGPDALPGLLEPLYEAAADPAAWSSFAARLSETFWGWSGLMARSTAGAPALAAHAVDPFFREQYERRWWRSNPWDRGATARPDLRAFTSEERCDPDALRRTAFYNELLRPADILHGLWMRVGSGSARSIELISHRSGRHGPYDAAERSLMETLGPHVHRAVRIADRLGTTAAGAWTPALAERLDTAVLAVEEGGLVVSATPAAERLLAAAPALRVSRGRLRAARPEDSRRLAALIDAVATRKASALERVLVLGGDDGPSLRLAVTPVPGAVGPPWARPTALVVLAAPPPAPAADVIARCYGLTGAEARLVAALCAGRTLAGYAEAAGIRPQTAKDYLKSVFGKTGVGRQVDLVRRIAADPLVRALSEPEAGERSVG